MALSRSESSLSLQIVKRVSDHFFKLIIRISLNEKSIDAILVFVRSECLPTYGGKLTEYKLKLYFVGNLRTKNRSNAMAETFVRAFKRDWVRVSPLPDAAAARTALPAVRLPR